MEAPGRQDRPESAPEGGGEPTRELTAGGGQFLLRADVVEFRRGDLLGGRYQIEKGIGRGATGSVLQAFDRVVRSVVAVKILRPDLATDERWIERLGGELRYARKLSHPNVCRVFDLAESDGHHYLTMEFAGGGSLRQRLADKPDRSWEDRIADARAVIEGLVAIHAANIVHRDVKPENVLVMDDGRLVVSDFGVAVSAGQTTYFSSKVAGTPSYMAPEVIMGDKATPRADVFSLGIVLHEILFGKRPDWQMTPKGRVIKSGLGKKATAREKAFERLCAECLREFAPERLTDAAEVKRRFEQAVAGRLRPIRELRQRWPLVATAALAVGAAALAVGMARGRSFKAPRTAHEPLPLAGSAANLAAVSHTIFSSEKPLRCFDVLPGGKSVRFVWQRPLGAVDVDLNTGEQAPADLVPDAIRSGCPQMSPDGRRLLYVKDDDSRRSQIMLSPHPDGSEATPITEGTAPQWLPSGEEFLYSFDNHRPAAFALPKTRLLFPDSPPVEKLLQQIAVHPSGDKVAFLFMDPNRQVTIDVHNYPSLERVQHVQLAQTVGGIQFDAVRGTLQLSVPDPRELTLAELTGSNELVRLGKIGGTNVLNGFRTHAGVAILTATFSYSMVREGPGGRSREYPLSVSGRADVAANGDVLFDRRTDDGRFVIAHQRSSEAESTILSEGPADMYPTFGPGGRTFTFIRVSDGAIVSCDIDGSHCRQSFTDPLGPRFARLSPDGRAVAYQTTHGSASRLRIVNLENNSMRDLGVYRSNCPPAWASASGIWTYDRAASQWREIDVQQGRQTGRVAAAESKGTGWVCDGAPPALRQPFSLHRVESQKTELRVSSGY